MAKGRLLVMALVCVWGGGGGVQSGGLRSLHTIPGRW